MGANELLGLPRANMQTIRIAFDVDGTLRCNCTETCTDANINIVALFNILNRFKNTELYVWSGGGAEYARNAAMRYGLAVPDKRCIGKIGSSMKPDIAIDDIQDTALGILNLIVREK